MTPALWPKNFSQISGYQWYRKKKLNKTATTSYHTSMRWYPIINNNSLTRLWLVLKGNQPPASVCEKNYNNLQPTLTTAPPLVRTHRTRAGREFQLTCWTFSAFLLANCSTASTAAASIGAVRWRCLKSLVICAPPPVHAHVAKIAGPNQRFLLGAIFLAWRSSCL